METPSPVRLIASDLDLIRQSVDWQALFIQLNLRKDTKKSKPDDWWAFSPFHEETRASFHMIPGGKWYDFSIGAGGGPIELIQRLHNCNCYEAGQWLLTQGLAHLPTSRPGQNLHTESTSDATRQSTQTALKEKA